MNAGDRELPGPDPKVGEAEVDDASWCGAQPEHVPISEVAVKQEHRQFRQSLRVDLGETALGGCLDRLCQGTISRAQKPHSIGPRRRVDQPFEPGQDLPSGPLTQAIALAQQFGMQSCKHRPASGVSGR
jgi:hypothetical protein